MSLWSRFTPARIRRWRALRGARQLAPDSPEGSLVQVTGIVREVDGADTVIAPVANKPCVILWTKYQILDPPRRNSNSRTTTVIERLHVQPFALEIETDKVVVDSGHVRLLLPPHVEGNMTEKSVAIGRRVTVVGHVLRDGIERPIARPDDDLAFRETVFGCKLVGSRQHPVVILEAT